LAATLKAGERRGMLGDCGGLAIWGADWTDPWRVPAHMAGLVWWRCPGRPHPQSNHEFSGPGTTKILNCCANSEESVIMGRAQTLFSLCERSNLIVSLIVPSASYRSGPSRPFALTARSRFWKGSDLSGDRHIQREGGHNQQQWFPGRENGRSEGEEDKAKEKRVKRERTGWGDVGRWHLMSTASSSEVTPTSQALKFSAGREPTAARQA